MTFWWKNQGPCGALGPQTPHEGQMTSGAHTSKGQAI